MKKPNDSGITGNIHVPGLSFKLRAVHISLLLILILAIGLRFYRLGERGLFQSDEGVYFMGALTQRAVLDWVTGRVLGTTQNSLREALLENGGTNPTYAKPGFDGLIVLASIAIGMQDYTSLVVSAIFGALTVLVVYLLGKNLYGEKIGLIAAGVLAALNYHVVFSRSGFPSTTSVFFVMLGFLFYLRAKGPGVHNYRWQTLAGLSIGYAFTCHYNLFYVPLVFGVFELVGCCKAEDRLIGVKRLLLFATSMLVPLLAFEVVYGTAKHIVYGAGMGDVLAQTNFGRFMSYFEQVLNQIGGVASSAGEVRDLLFYPKLFVYFDGYVVSVLSLCGVGVAVRSLRKNSLGEQTALSLLAVAFSFWSLLSTLQFGRSLLLITPLLALFAAKGMMWLAGGRRALAVGLAMLTIGYGVYHTIPTLGAKSGYRKAVAYMQAHHGIKHISTMPTVSRVYTGAWQDVLFSRSVSLAEISELRRAGFRYLLWDPSGYAWLGDEFVERASACPPVFEVEHNTHVFLYETGEEWRNYVISQPQVLRVYDLESLLD